MTLVDWVAIVVGATAVVCVFWYFFGTNSSAPSAAGSSASGDLDPTGAARARNGEPRQATIVVEGGYTPSVVNATAGEPIRLVFDRRETSGCSEEVVLPDFGIRRYLPAHQQTVVDVTPPAPGTYSVTCGMGMLRGRLVAS